MATLLQIPCSNCEAKPDTSLDGVRGATFGRYSLERADSAASELVASVAKLSGAG